MLGNIDEAFTNIETSFMQIAKNLGPHPNTLAATVAVLPHEDPLDVYHKLLLLFI